jgi:excisionase family DNA binding protein
MLNVEIRFIAEGKEVSLNTFAETLVLGIRTSVREEINRSFGNQASEVIEPSAKTNSEMPRQAVSVREAARLLSLSPRTLHNYIASIAIRVVRVGRRVLIPMKSVNEVATKGVPRRRNQVPTGE